MLAIIGTIFVVLKLIGIVEWNWWIVMAPFWVPLAWKIFKAVIEWIDDLFF